MTSTAAEAYEAMLAHRRRLGGGLTGRAAAINGMVAAGLPYSDAVANLRAYLAQEVLPHAAAEERIFYPAAARAGLAGAVVDMLAEHVTLASAAARLSETADGEAVAGCARDIAALFAGHAARENEVLLPALLADESVDLAALLGQMHGS